ncbi:MULTISPECIES: hypothetical protein [Lactobacillus]|uniref:hypothetical protein n=1 Tax=Lactobacillus TaxID=1578 RepID=UPI000BEEBDB9|nr:MULTISPECIES: hypothetical protein [Lactobacillus]PEG89853.1 hypothetical protein CP363_10375 [Lactobacillus sp. UMNPBX12]PEG91805.1 hypothetical protein CP362_10225 [Lactobacillus sp. UMNPBX11]
MSHKKSLVIVIIICIVGIVGLFCSFVSTQNTKWEAIGSWFSGLASSGALIFAYLQINSIQQEENAKILDRITSQANNLGIWVEEDEYTNIVLLNTSNMPFYDVYIFVMSREGEITRKRISILPPGKWKLCIDISFDKVSYIDFSFKDSRQASWYKLNYGNLYPVNINMLKRISRRTPKDSYKCLIKYDL